MLFVSLHACGQIPIPFGTGKVTTSPFQAETIAYLNAESAAGKTFTTAQQDSIDIFFQRIKGISNPKYTTYNVISRIIAIYPLLCGVSAYDRINMVNPGTNDALETGSPTYNTSTLTVAFNGSSNYWDSQFIPNNTGSPTAFSGFGIYRTDANNDGNATFGVASSGNSYALNRGDAFNQFYDAGNNVSSGSNAVKSFKWVAWSSTTDCGYYVNGSVIGLSTGLSFNNSGNKSLLVGAFNAGAVTYGGACTYGFVIIVKGTWTGSESAFIFSPIKDLKQSFGVTFP